MAGGIIFADANHLDAMLPKGIPLITKIAGLLGAARRVIFGIKVNNHPLADQVGEVDYLAVLVGQAEVWGGISDLQGHWAWVTVPKA